MFLKRVGNGYHGGLPIHLEATNGCKTIVYNDENGNFLYIAVASNADKRLEKLIDESNEKTPGSYGLDDINAANKLLEFLKFELDK